MTDKIRQGAQECAEEICLNGVGIGLTDRIERAMRKLVPPEPNPYAIAMEKHLCAHDMADWLACAGHGDNFCSACNNEKEHSHTHNSQRVAQAFSDGAAQHEKVWGAALMSEIANLKAQQAERIKEAVEAEREVCIEAMCVWCKSGRPFRDAGKTLHAVDDRNEDCGSFAIRARRTEAEKMSEMPMNKLDELIAKVIDAGCSCDMMNGYRCGIHAPIAELRAILPDVKRLVEALRKIANTHPTDLESPAHIELYAAKAEDDRRIARAALALFDQPVAPKETE